MRISEPARLSISLMPAGWPVRTLTCPDCRGSKIQCDSWAGEAWPCPTCKGEGRVPEKKEVSHAPKI